MVHILLLYSHLYQHIVSFCRCASESGADSPPPLAYIESGVPQMGARLCIQRFSSLGTTGVIQYAQELTESNHFSASGGFWYMDWPLHTAHTFIAGGSSLGTSQAILYDIAACDVICTVVWVACAVVCQSGLYSSPHTVFLIDCGCSLCTSGYDDPIITIDVGSGRGVVSGRVRSSTA
ncbi:hypothetical protein SARC_09898, partial [Sphaeroforma arctica JP610]